MNSRASKGFYLSGQHEARGCKGSGTSEGLQEDRRLPLHVDDEEIHCEGFPFLQTLANS